MKYKNVRYNDIFKDFVVSVEPEIPVDKLKEEAYQIKEENKGIKYTNREGYHSPGFDSDLGKEYFSKLIDYVEGFSTSFLMDNGYNYAAAITEWWVNINPQYGYNVLHSHGRTPLIAIYYIEALGGESELSILRNDGSMYSNLYANMPDTMKIEIPVETGRLFLLPGHLQHYVSANPIDDDRISVSFNIDVV